MKIVFLTEFFPTKAGGALSGGSEARTYYVSFSLSKHPRNQVYVVTSCLLGAEREEKWGRLLIFRVGPRRVYTQSGDFWRRLLFFLAAVAKTIELRADVVDGNNAAVYWAAWFGARMSLAKVVYWIPDVLFLRAWWEAAGFVSGVMLTFLERLVSILPADRVIALSQTTKRKVLRLGVDKAKIDVVYPGCPPPVRETKGLGKAMTLVSIHRLVSYKRTDLAVRAVSLLARSYPALSYRIVGTGPEQNNLNALVGRLGLRKKVVLLGNRNRREIFRELSRGTIFLLPSEVEGFGMATLEAASRGLPFVNSDIAVHREIEKVGQGGLLFRSGEASDLAEKIGTLFKKPSLYRRLSRNALAFGRKYTWQRCVKETESLYVSLYRHRH